MQEHAGFIKSIIYRSIVTTVFFGIAIVILQETKVANSKDYLEAFAIGIFSSFGLVSYVSSLKFTTVSLAVPVAGTSAFFGVVTALFVLHEPFDISLVYSFLLIFVALVLLSMHSTVLRLNTGVLLNLSAAFFWGVSFTLFYIPIQQISVWQFGCVLELSVLITAFTIAILSKERPRLSEFRQHIKWILILSILGFAAVASFNISTHYLPMSLLSLIGISTIFISLALSRWWLKESLNKREWLSMSLFVAAILLLKWTYG